MELLIVTGMSGAGKSKTANTLEDIGYYCVDNVPPLIIPDFVSLSSRSNGFERMAIVTDVRTGEHFSLLSSVLEELGKNGIDFKILFLDSSDEVLAKRFKENRRKHPLCDDTKVSVGDAVKRERELLKNIRLASDYILDTSNLSDLQLRQNLSKLFLNGSNNGFSVRCMSFGFKYGPVTDADIMLDVRCLPNPFYVESLRTHTGLEKSVYDYIFSDGKSGMFLDKLLQFIDYAVPLYQNEGKTQLVIAIGCTGGKHRSVAFAERIKQHLSDNGLNVVSVHRDIDKQVI